MEEFKNLNEEEKLKAENDFLKMKIMLEHGAQFGGNETNELPAEVENEFLNNMMAFEKQFEEHKTIKVFDKIGRPQHFRPVNEISDENMGEAWNELRDYMNEHGIDLDVCSPNITMRELYRFTTEELFEHETDDMYLPGFTTNFIYDEFHPDPVYDNMKIATDDCINYILQKEPMEWTHHFRKENLRLNDQHQLTIDELKNLVSKYKTAYDTLEIKKVAANNCVVNAKDSFVTGSYLITATTDMDSFTVTGNWKVILECDEESGYWYITGIEIEGINFQ